MIFIFQCVDYSDGYFLMTDHFDLTPRGVYDFIQSDIFMIAWNSPVYQISFRQFMHSVKYRRTMSISDFITFYDLFCASVFLYKCDVSKVNSFCFLPVDSLKL